MAENKQNQLNISHDLPKGKLVDVDKFFAEIIEIKKLIDQEHRELSDERSNTE